MVAKKLNRVARLHSISHTLHMEFSSKLLRTVQIGIALITLVISGVLINQGNTISSEAAAFSDFSGEIFNATTPKGANILSTVASSLTMADKGLLYASNWWSKESPVFYKRKSSRFTLMGLPLKQMSFLTGILGSEMTENLLWFSSMSLGMILTGDWDCNDVASLLNNYNLTRNDMVSLSVFFDSPVNITESGSEVDATVSERQNRLIMKLGQNCSINKAATAVSALNMFFYMVTGGVMVSSFVVLKRQLDLGSGLVSLLYDDPFFMPRARFRFARDEPEKGEGEHQGEHQGEGEEGEGGSLV